MSTDNPYQPPTVNIETESDNELQLANIAKWQRIILYAILLYIVLIIMEIVIKVSIGAILVIIPLVLSLIGVTFLAYALWQSYIIAAFYCLCMFVPLLNLLMLFFINTRASARLRAGGYKVGLLGASQKHA
jgi:uncharacterized membrane protein